MGNGRRLQCGGEVIEVRAEEEPLVRVRRAENRSDEHTTPARTGRAARTMPIKARVTTTGGFLGSELKV